MHKTHNNMVRLKRSMSVLKLVIFISIIFVTGCKKDNYKFEEIIGKWQLVKGYDHASNFYSIDHKDKRIEKYTKDHERIRYDYVENEISRCSFSATDSVITIYVERSGKEVYESSYKYWFKQDTLVIHNVGGNHYYNEFFVRIE